MRFLLKQSVNLISLCVIVISNMAVASVDFGGRGAAFLVGAETKNEHNQRDYIFGDISGFMDAKTEISQDKTIGFYSEIETESDDFLKESYVYFQTNWGRFELGRAKNMAEKMFVSLPDATGLRLNRESYIYDFFDLKSVSVLSSSAITTDDHTQKISLISKSWNGWQGGVSILPQSFNKQQTTSGILDHETAKQGAIASVKYKGYLTDAIELSTSVGGAIFDDFQNFQTDPVGMHQSFEKRKEVSVGINLDFAGWTLGLTGRKIDETQHPLDFFSDSQEGQTWGAGIGYEFLMFDWSLSFQQSELEGNIFDANKDISKIIMTGISYKYTPEIKLWTGGGYAVFQDESHQKDLGNQGGFLSLGISVNF